MPALNGAFAFAEHFDVAMLIRKDLKLDMPRRFNEFLHVHIAAGEGGRRLRLGPGQADGRDRAESRTMRMPRPPPPAAAFSITG